MNNNKNFKEEQIEEVTPHTEETELDSSADTKTDSRFSNNQYESY